MAGEELNDEFDGTNIPGADGYDAELIDNEPTDPDADVEELAREYVSDANSVSMENIEVLQNGIRFADREDSGIGVSSMREMLRPDGRRVSESVDTAELFAFIKDTAEESSPATEWEEPTPSDAVSESNTGEVDTLNLDGDAFSAGVLWGSVKNAYEEAVYGDHRKETAREKVAEALEAETEWMWITDRSDEQHTELWRYDHSENRWKDDGTLWIRQKLREELGSLCDKAEWNKVRDLVATANPVHSDELNATGDDRTLIPFENGVLVLESIELDEDGYMKTGQYTLLEHDPAFKFTFRFEAAWNPSLAQFDVIDEFMRDITGPFGATDQTTDIRTLWEFAGHSFFEYYHPEAFLIFSGEGGDGKTVFFTVVQEALGDDNHTGTTLEKIADGQFSTWRVAEARANIAPEIGGSDAVIHDISELKSMTGADMMEVEPKHKAAYDVRNSATMMFGSNNPPAFTEKSRALKRRLYPVEAPYTFHDDPDPNDPRQKQKRSKPELLSELTAPATLAAAAVRMAEGARRLQVNDEFTLGQELSPDERLEAYEEDADPMADFARTCIEEDPHGPGVALDDIKDAYDAYALEHDHPEKPRNTIKGQLERARDLQIRRSDPRSWTEEEGDRTAVYKGIRFTGAVAEYLPANAFWEQYDGLENPHATDDEDVSESVEFTDVEDLDPGRHDVRVTVKNVREDPAPWLFDQGVVGDDSDVIRYEIPEGEQLEEGAVYHLMDAVVQPDDADLKLQIVPGMTDVRFIKDGSRDDDQEPMDAADDGVSEPNGEEDRGDAGESVPQNDRVQTVKKAVKTVGDGGKGAPVARVKAELAKASIDPEKAEKEIKKLLMKGELFESTADHLRVTAE
ncbi:DNA primase family protein [Halomicrobium urmianum]|uniref:DNA primase family protein n=1 Tax=Halomicrobium urmianum TaxID=1586233 RepID=UPI001CD92883|nr:DUF5906 domain-containing protein [Halomicrobium urmianum]